jgi:hypothetical protein
MLPETITPKKPRKARRLSRALQDDVSEMLAQGLATSAIVEKLSAQGKKVSAEQITEWQQDGHKEWVRERERLEGLDRLREMAKQVPGSSGGNLIQEAGLRMAADQIYEMLCWFNPKVFKKKVQENLADYARVIAMLVRLSEGGLKYERYRAEVAERKASMEQELTAAAKTGGVSPEFLEFMERELKLL